MKFRIYPKETSGAAMGASFDVEADHISSFDRAGVSKGDRSILFVNPLEALAVLVTEIPEPPVVTEALVESAPEPATEPDEPIVVAKAEESTEAPAKT